jgi:hypothetical protein
MLYYSTALCTDANSGLSASASCGSDGFAAISISSNTLSAQSHGYADVQTSIFYVPSGLTGIQYETDTGAASGVLAISHSGGDGTCALTFSESANVSVTIHADTLGPKGSFGDRSSLYELNPTGHFYEAVYNFFDGSTSLGSTVRQGLIGRKASGATIALGTLSGISPSTSGGTTIYSDTVDTDISLPVGTTAVTSSATSRSVVCNGDILRHQTSNHEDLVAMQGANGSSLGDANYIPEADMDLSGTIDSDDFALLRQKGCPADINNDGVVDDSDYALFVIAYDSYYSSVGDFNGDGVTDDTDFSYFTTAYDQLTCTPLAYYVSGM